MFAFRLNSDFQDDDWCCKNSPKMPVNAFHLPSWNWLLLENSAGFIRNSNHLAAFCPEPSLQLLIICYVSRFCPFLIVKVAATSSFHLGRYCCIDGCRGSFLWSLQKQKTPKFRQGMYNRRITLHHRTLPVTISLLSFVPHLWSLCTPQALMIKTPAIQLEEYSPFLQQCYFDIA